MQQFQNFANDTLASGINSSVTTIPVSDGSKWPATGDFYVIIDTEIMKITARSGNDLTAVRGQENTTAASHSSGVAVTWVMTASTLEGFCRDNTDFGNVSGFSPGKQGRVIIPNDIAYFLYDNGTTFDSFGLMNRIVPPPALAGWTQDNLGTGTVADLSGGIRITTTFNAGQDCKIIQRTAPATPWTVECRLDVNRYARYNAGGLFARTNGSTKFHGIQVVLGGNIGPYLEIVKFDSPTAYNSSGNFCHQWDQYPMANWLQIHNDGTDLHFRFSVNGLHYKTLQQISRTNFLTGAADRIGIWGNSTHGSINTSLFLSHWKVF